MESKVIERYNGHVGVGGAWLAEYIGKNIYDNSLKRGTIRSLRRGGNGRTALIDWQSMGTKMKARVIEALGCDPRRCCGASCRGARSSCWTPRPTTTTAV